VRPVLDGSSLFPNSVATQHWRTVTPTIVALANQSCGQDVGGLWKTPDRAGRLPSSDVKPHGNDRLGYHPQAGVVVAGVPADESVSLIDRDRVLECGDPLGLFDDDP
jgi:hypothetical protein